jgi:hypothetical protein
MGITEAEITRLFQQVHYQVKSYGKSDILVNAGELCDR